MQAAKKTFSKDEPKEKNKQPTVEHNCPAKQWTEAWRGFTVPTVWSQRVVVAFTSSLRTLLYNQHMNMKQEYGNLCIPAC